MMHELWKALAGIGVILGLWLLVQRTFRRAAGLAVDADPLAGHFRCHGCTCEGACENKDRPTQPHTNR